jgi:hypothetical protein
MLDLDYPFFASYNGSTVRWLCLDEGCIEEVAGIKIMMIIVTWEIGFLDEP